MYQLLVSVFNILDIVKCICFVTKWPNVTECYYVTVSVLFCHKITYNILYLLSVDFLQFVNIL